MKAVDIALITFGCLVGVVALIILSVICYPRCKRSLKRRRDSTTTSHSQRRHGGRAAAGRKRTLEEALAYMAFRSPFASDEVGLLEASGSNVDSLGTGTQSLLPSELAESESGWDNPLFEDGLGEVIENPTFDEEIRRQRDLIINLQANVRRYQQRQRYVRIRSAIIRFQALWRGFWTRRKVIPRIRDRHRLHQEKRLNFVGVDHVPMNKQPFITSKPEGLLKALPTFRVRFIGAASVSKRSGVEVVQEAIRRIKEKVERSKRRLIRLSVSVHSVKFVHHTRWAILGSVPIQSITFCTTDPEQRRLFAFISSHKKNRSKCFVFFCIHNNAPTISLTLAEAFHKRHKLDTRRGQGVADQEEASPSPSKSLQRQEAMDRRSLDVEEFASKTLPTASKLQVDQGLTEQTSNSIDMIVRDEFDAIAAEYDEMLHVLDSAMHPGHLKLARLQQRDLSHSVEDLLHDNEEGGNMQDAEEDAMRQQHIQDDLFADIDMQVSSMLDLANEDFA